MFDGVSPDAVFTAAVSVLALVFGGLIWLARRMGNLDALEKSVADLTDLVRRELTHNGGKSTKDLARDSRDASQTAQAALLKVTDLSERTSTQVAALHRRLDSDMVTRAEADGARKAQLEHLQQTATRTRMDLSLHVYESNKVLKALEGHGVEVEPFTHPDGSPLAPPAAPAI